MTTAEKIAVVVFNLGGPLSEADIEPFLYNFFMDKNIIALPWLFRQPVARLISRRRSRREAREAYGRIGFSSPLLENTQNQALALERALTGLGLEARVFVSMRYWRPFSRDTIRELDAYAPDRLVLLPLYPQYSRTTTGSSFEDFLAVLGTTVKSGSGSSSSASPGAWKNGKNAVLIDSYPVLPGLIRAAADNIRLELSKAPPGARLLLSAHGLPEKIIAAGDPYQRHCEQTAQAIAAELKLSPEAWQLCYQSRVGPLRWIGPSIDEALQKAAQDKVSGVVVYPHAFVSEHVETLVELDIEYRHRAAALGLPWYGRAKTAGVHPEFIAGLAGLVAAALNAGTGGRDNLSFGRT